MLRIGVTKNVPRDFTQGPRAWVELRMEPRWKVNKAYMLYFQLVKELRIAGRGEAGAKVK